MPTAKRILYVTNDAEFFLGYGGLRARGALEAGWDVHVGVPEHGPVAEIRAQGFTYHPLRFERGYGRPRAELAALRSLYRLYRAVRPDLLHLVSLKPVIYGGMLARLARVPAVVADVTGFGQVLLRKGPRAALTRAVVSAGLRATLGHRRMRVIVENDADRDMLIGKRLARTEQVVLSHGAGVDMERFAPRPLPEGDPLVILPARMLWDKGVGEFVEAARRIRAQGSAAKFALVGEADAGNPDSVKAAQLQAWNNAGEVEWWGRRGDMPSVYTASHIVCLPTRYGEGLPRVLLEAAAAGRPIVATDHAACRRVVRDGENGLLVPVGEGEALSAALTDALSRLLGDPALRARMGEAGRRIVEGQFTAAHAVAQTLDVYRQLTDGTGTD